MTVSTAICRKTSWQVLFDKAWLMSETILNFIKEEL